MKKILLFYILINVGHLNSQNFQWAYDLGSAQGNSILHDKAGNCIVTGLFGVTVDFNPGIGVDTLNANGSVDLYVAKYDASGNYLWAFAIGDTVPYQTTSQSVSLDTNENICITGWFSGKADFDPGPGVHYLNSNNYPSFFVAKYDVNGNYLWAFSLGHSPKTYPNGYSTAFDGNGNIFVTGSFEDTLDFDPSTSVHNLMADSSSSMFLAKYNANGQYMWAISAGQSNTYGFGLTTDKYGNVIVTGIFSDTVDFNPGSGVNNVIAKGYSDIFIAKYNGNGNYLWAFGIGAGSSAQSGGISVACDTSCNIFATGYFAGNANFNPTGSNYLSATGNGSAYIAKYDLNGNYLGARRIGNNVGTDFSRGNCVTTDISGNIFVTGSFRGVAYLDAGGTHYLTANGDCDIFLVSYDNQGNYLWAFNIGASNDCVEGQSVSVDNNGYVWITGHYYGSNCDFDPGAGVCSLSCVTTFDGYIAKYSSPQVGIGHVNLVDAEILIYPNPTSGKFTIESSLNEKQPVQVYDVNGRLVLSQQINGTTNIDASSLDDGIYTLRIKSSTVVENKKLIISR